MTDAVKMAIDRIKARFHPQYGIDGASDSKQLASDCQTLIAALEQAGEPVAERQIYVREPSNPNPMQGEYVVTAADLERPLSTLQRLGQDFDAPPVKECLTTAADAGVTQGDREAAVDIHNVILHDWFTQHMIDGMEDECYVIQAFKNHRLQSVAAATAAKDAEIARLRAVIKHTADSIENGEDCWVNLYATMCCSGRDCGCQGSSHADLIVHDFHAALSEAREAGE